MTLRRFSSEKKFFGATVRIYSQGDSNVTSGAAAALLQNDTAMISVANRVIAAAYITMSWACGEQKHNPGAWRRQLSTGQRLRSVSRNFLRFVLRSGKILMQNRAMNYKSAVLPAELCWRGRMKAGLASSSSVGPTIGVRE